MVGKHHKLTVLTEEESARINVLRFPLIVGIVFIHAYPSTVNVLSGTIGGGVVFPAGDFIKNLISQVAARVSVPILFMISGYLLFLRAQERNDSYVHMLQRKSKTLLIPFLFWNALGLLIIGLGQSVSWTAPFFSANNPRVSEFGCYDYLNALLGLEHYPVAYQFWFIRDLMLLVLIMPVIHLLMKYSSIILIAVLGVFWVTATHWPFTAPSAEATLFFSIGAFLGVHKMSLFAFDSIGRAAICTYFPLAILDALTYEKPSNTIFHKTGILIGILAVLYMTSHVVRWKKLAAVLMGLAPASFFVFAIHEPLCTILRKIAYKILMSKSKLPELTFALYFIIPLVVVAVALYVYRALSGMAPRFVGLITGSRS